MAFIANQVYAKAVPVVTSNTANFVNQGRGAGGDQIVCDALFVGGAGIVQLVLQDGTVVPFTVTAVPFLLPVRAIRVNTTSTTASLMVALYSL